MIKARWKNSTSQTFSEYARRLFLGHPVVMTSRNLSLDDLIDTINEIRRDLRRLQESYTLNAEEKERVFSLIQELKPIFYQIAQLCIPK
jgi:hypothetical protein